MEPVEMLPPVLSIATFDMLKVGILSATKVFVTFRFAMTRLCVVKLAASTVSALRTPVLIVPAMTVFILK